MEVVLGKPIISYEEFLASYELKVAEKEDHIREGQLLMNYLWDVWEDEYKRIASVHYYDKTNIDCFYNDKLIPNTLKHLEKVWGEY